MAKYSLRKAAARPWYVKLIGGALFALIVYGQNGNAVTLCNPELSTPCGKGCIPKDKSCHKPWTTSKVGVRTSSGKTYLPTEVKYVEKAPDQGTPIKK